MQIATERGVDLRGSAHTLLKRFEAGERGDLGAVARLTLPVQLKCQKWGDLGGLDPLFEACRMPRKPRQTGSDEIDAASVRPFQLFHALAQVALRAAATCDEQCGVALIDEYTVWLLWVWVSRAGINRRVQCCCATWSRS